ncbi:ISNCY family transposase [Patescibacteria group bacterium]|nr:ISNCY family transposase [Patescibacteria group bacterium]
MSGIPLTPEELQKFNIIRAVIDRKFTNGEAARKLEISVRHLQRLKSDVQRNGTSAVIHKLKGKVGNHQIEPNIKRQVLNDIKSKYADFKPGLATEKLHEEYQLTITSQTIRVWMIEEGLWKMRKRRSVEYHAWRERKEYFGELEQFDGSYHFWFEGRLLDEAGNPQEVCLLASIDDATSKITHAKFELNEGVVAVFNFWMEYVKAPGKPFGIYLDKYSTYKINHKNAVDNAELLTQFQKAMRILNIEVIPANSPQAKGRVERLFQTLQDRLVKELRLNNISSIKDGNRLLKEIFIPKFNAKFSVVATKDGDIHRPLTKQERHDLTSIFSIKSIRRINHDFTIQFKSNFYQLEEIQPVTIRPKEKVLVEEWLNGTIHFKFKECYLKYFILPERPKKISSQPVILTNHPLNWKPPPDHPWRQFKYSTKRG